MTELLKDKPWVLGLLVMGVALAGFGVWNLTSETPYEWHGAAYDPPRSGVDCPAPSSCALSEALTMRVFFFLF